MKWQRAPRNNISLYFRQKDPIRNAHTPSMWHEEFTLPEKKGQFLFESFLNQVKAPPPTSHSRKDGKTNDYNRLFAFFLSPEEHKEQGLWQAPLFGCSASKETAPAGEMKVGGGEGQGALKNGECVGGGVGCLECQEGHGDGRWWGRSHPHCHNPCRVELRAHQHKDKLSQGEFHRQEESVT